jgi:gamma-aminobutyric acid receptor subunit alpha
LPSGATTVLTLSTIALESRTDLPKVHYATALDWFIICSFGYCIATLLEFAGVHYFTKVGSGEVFGYETHTEDELEFTARTVEIAGLIVEPPEGRGLDDHVLGDDDDWEDMEEVG